MLGLWGPNTAYGKHEGSPQKHHFAFAVPLNELFAAITNLNERRIEVLGFDGKQTREPTVIGWAPAGWGWPLHEPHAATSTKRTSLKPRSPTPREKFA